MTSSKDMSKRNMTHTNKLPLLPLLLGFGLSGAASAGYIEWQQFNVLQSGGTSTEGAIVKFEDLGNNVLQLTFDVFAPANYSSAVTGIVFNVDQDIKTASILSFTDGDGFDLMSVFDGWELGYNETAWGGQTTFDIKFHTGTQGNGNGTNIQGGIYDDDTLTSNTANIYPDVAVLQISITDPTPWKLNDIGNDSVLRMMRTGADGEGSLKLTSVPFDPSEPPLEVPVPGTLLLLAAPLLGLSAWRRRRS